MLADGSLQGETPRDEEHMMLAEEVAAHIYSAVVSRKRNLVLTFCQGKLIVLVGKIFPRLVDKQVYKTFAEEPDSPLE